MKLRTKVMLLFTLVIVMGTLAMGTFASVTMEAKVIREAEGKLSTDLALGQALLDAHVPGAWSLTGGQLYKGQQAVTAVDEVFAEFAEHAEGTVLIYQGQTHILTAGATAGAEVGKQSLADEAAAVLQSGQRYLGEADVLGTPSLTAIQPLVDAQGKVIGLLQLSLPIAPYDALIGDFRTNVTLFGVGGLLVAIIASYVVAQATAKPLVQVTQVATRVAAGDLTVEKQPDGRSDELGQLARAVNAMVDHLRHVLLEVNGTATQVANASQVLSGNTEATSQTTEQISAAIREVAVGAEHQVQGAAHSAGAIEEMSLGMQRIAETSVQVTEVSMHTASEAEQGDLKVKGAVEQMQLIAHSAHESAKSVKQLELRSFEIEQIVEVITSIAQQTNLLALNAAIEAARAGEHGKGFSVVADEVRKLAEQSGRSAGQIAQLIRTIQTETAKSVGSMDEVIHEVEAGMAAVQEAGDAFHRILDSSKRVADMIQDVTAASEEMSANSVQVADSVAEMTRIARDSAQAAEAVATSSVHQLTAIEEIATSTDSLNRMAHQLRELIGKFQV